MDYTTTLTWLIIIAITIITFTMSYDTPQPSFMEECTKEFSSRICFEPNT